MTAVYPFAPSTSVLFQFSPTLDGQVYNVVVKWNVTGQRWYLTLSDLSNNPILTLPLIGSPNGALIESASWENGLATVVTSAPHRFKVYSTIDIAVAGCMPDAYNGNVEAFIVDAVTFQYPVASDPGLSTQLGSATYNINLVEGYFNTSTLVFREASQQFEVSP